MVKVH